MKLHSPTPLALALAALLSGAAAVSLLARAAHAQGASDASDDTAAPPPPSADEEEEAAPAEAQPPPAAPDQATFEQKLSPYGRWTDTPEYGRVWIPSEAARADWQPYTDGRWVWVDGAWSFAPSVPWGWAAFHYGRWAFGTGYGWYWVPGYTWAPAWVSWRFQGGHYCWAPYGPRGYVYPRHYAGWVVVPREHFRYPISRVVLPQAHARAIVRASRPGPSIANAPVRGQHYGPPRAAAHPSGGGRGGARAGGRGGHQR